MYFHRIIFIIVIILFIINCSATAEPIVSEQPPSSANKQLSNPLPGNEPWEIEFSLSGGIMGVRRLLVLNNPDQLLAKDEKWGKMVNRSLTEQQRMDIEKYLAALDFSHQVTAPVPCPDCFDYVINITLGHSRYHIQTNTRSRDNYYSAFIATFSSLMNNALDVKVNQ